MKQIVESEMQQNDVEIRQKGVVRTIKPEGIKVSQQGVSGIAHV